MWSTCSDPQGPELLIATTKDWKQRKLLREQGCPRGRIPQGLGPRERMERKLLTKRGRAFYKKRGILVEPVYGQMKEGQGFRRFMRRGLDAATSETSLVATTHNLLKLWRSGTGALGLGQGQVELTPVAQSSLPHLRTTDAKWPRLLSAGAQSTTPNVTQRVCETRSKVY